MFFKVAFADVKSITTSTLPEAEENESHNNIPLASIPETSPESSPINLRPGLSIAEHKAKDFESAIPFISALPILPAEPKTATFIIHSFPQVIDRIKKMLVLHRVYKPFNLVEPT